MSTRDDIAELIDLAFEASNDVDHMAHVALALLAERGMVVLGPDGEPLDVRGRTSWVLRDGTTVTLAELIACYLTARSAEVEA